MKIESIGLALPARKVTNDDILSEIAERSTGFKGDLTQALRTVDIMLRHSGSSTRYWKDDTQNSLDLAVAAGRDALARLDGDDHSVDLILYASVYSELKEPSSSGPIAHELGMDESSKDGVCTHRNRAVSPDNGGDFRVFYGAQLRHLSETVRAGLH